MKTLVILAGGKSSRMGKDKIFLHCFDGTTFIGHLCQQASDYFDQVVISAGSKEHADGIRTILPEVRIIPDRYDAIGPMGGILSIYEETGIQTIAVIPADVPGAEMSVLSYFYDQCGTESCFLTDNKHPEPLIGAYGKAALDRMQEARQSGCYKLMSLITEKTRLFTEEQLKAAMPQLQGIDLKKAFKNINTINEYEEYRTRPASGFFSD